MTNRAEVAERLRVYATDFDFGDSNPIWYVEKAVFNDIKIREQGRVFSRLADLIDPVCHAVVDLESDGIGAPYRYTSRCSNCGQVWGEAIYFPHVPIYCPVCGARVVRDDL